MIKVSINDFFRFQMAYMLLWSSIERYCSFKYNRPTIGKNNREFAKEKVFKKALKKYVESERKVYSSVDLKEHVLNPENPIDSIFYYYTIRCNSVHTGKNYITDEYMIKQSLKELLNIYKDVIDDTVKHEK